MTAFQHPNVTFVNINTAEFDAYKVGAIPVVADARVALERLNAVLVDNGGFASIGSLSRSLGQGGFGTSYRARDGRSGQLDGETLKVDFAANARSLGAHAIKAATLDELRDALTEAKAADRTTVIVVETDATVSVPGYDSWWDVAVAEVSEMESVREARTRYEEARKRERQHL